MARLVLASVVLIAALSVAFLRMPSDRMPQKTAGEGTLAVAFADARGTLSRAAVHKADSYFHGGVDMECHECHHHHDEGEECGHDEHGEHHDRDEERFDAWAWINGRIRAPEIERHLEGVKSVELMPWLWASVKADPKNVSAWSDAWYIAISMVKDEALAARIIAAGRKENPNSLELAYDEARGIWRKGTGDLVLAEAAFASVKALAMKLCGGDLSRLKDEDSHFLKFTERFLDEIAKKKKLSSAGTVFAN